MGIPEAAYAALATLSRPEICLTCISGIVEQPRQETQKTEDERELAACARVDQLDQRVEVLKHANGDVETHLRRGPFSQRKSEADKRARRKRGLARQGGAGELAHGHASKLHFGLTGLGP